MTAATARSASLLAVLLLALGLPQLALTAHTTDMHVDGGYYLDVAMHVRDGLGLRSDVSLYHAGFAYFPHPSPIYPLWPLLLGYLGRVVEITDLAHWLPFSLWGLSLVGAWLFGRALLPGRLGPIAGVDAGHLLVLMLGTQREYSRFSTMPYTEALAFALLTLFLWRACRLRPDLRGGLELGLWLALLCLTRSQLFIAPIAAGLTVGLLALSGRAGRRWVGPGLLALAVVGLALGAWWLRSRSFVVDAGPLTLLRFDQAQATTVLSPIDVLKDTRGPAELLLDRLSGLLVAWSPTDWSASYARGFFTWHWALPLALLALPAARPRRASVAAFLGRPEAFRWLLVGLLALGALATVHLPHKEGFGDWYFHRRHAIICVLPFFLATLLLARHPWRAARAAALALVIAGAAFSVDSLYWRLERATQPPEPDPDAALVEWLQARATAEDPLVVAVYAFKPPELAWRTDHVGYHWFYERTALEDLRLMFDELGAKYLVLRSNATAGWRFRESREDFQALFQPVIGGPRGVQVYRRRASQGP